MRLIALSLTCCLIFCDFLYSQQLLLVPEPSAVTFKIKSWGFTVDGKFEGLQLDATWNPDNLEQCHFKASVQAKTVDANIDARNKSLRGEDYFFVEKFPEIIIESKSIAKGETGYILNGNLKIRDVIRPIQLPFTVKKSDGLIIFDGAFTVDRLEYKVGPNTFSMGDEARVFIHCVTKSQ